MAQRGAGLTAAAGWRPGRHLPLRPGSPICERRCCSPHRAGGPRDWAGRGGRGLTSAEPPGRTGSPRPAPGSPEGDLPAARSPPPGPAAPTPPLRPPPSNRSSALLSGSSRRSEGGRPGAPGGLRTPFRPEGAQPAPRQLPWRRPVPTTSAAAVPAPRRFSLSVSSSSPAPDLRRPSRPAIARPHSPSPAAPHSRSQIPRSLLRPAAPGGPPPLRGRNRTP